VRRAKM